MRTWMRTLVFAAAPALALTACGGGAANSGEGGEAGLDCHGVKVIVPYSPGGGSDQQVRRLQPALEEALDTKLNITYQTGGDGSVGWNALHNAKPDGCTIGNVVAPNIVLLSVKSGEDVGFDYSDFEYPGWTEFSPNMLLVAQDSKYKTFDDFVQAAKATPGKLTVNGVGATGQLLFNEMVAATGLELTYVPVSGGVGDMIPQVVGGHVDAAITGASGLAGGQLRPLVLSGESDKFGDIPTYEEAGFSGVKLVTSWGLLLPPETPDDIVKLWNDAIEQALDDSKVKEAYAESKFTVLRQTPDEALDYVDEQAEATKSALKAQSG